MKRLVPLLLLAGFALVAGAGCGDAAEGTPTAVSSPAAAATDTATSAPRPTQTPRPTRTPTPTLPAPAVTATPEPPDPADGTVDALNPGDTAPKQLKPNPSSFTGPAFLVDVRMAFHPEAGGWERVVFELESAGVPATAIEYRDPVVLCGSGKQLHAPEGRAALVVELQSTAAHDEQGEITLRSGETDLPGLRAGTIVGGRQICDFEGVVAWVFELRAERNFKVSTLEDPIRVIVDVKR
ncbi:MAG: hypothetical protein ACE5EF_03965 [Dehalococcoidia bacterium]